MSLLSGKRASLDSTCAEAVDAAREALVEVAPPGSIGEHLGVEPEQERVVTHYFAADLPGYRGWRWAVTVMRASRSKVVTVAESVLLPGDESLLPPSWVPWTDRLRPGDLGVGDLLPTDEDDPRLEPGWNASDTAAGVVPAEAGLFGSDAALAEPAVSPSTDELADDEVHEDGWVDTDAGFAVAIELDLLRPRVLSPIGLDDAVDRWRSGDHGPDAPMAQSAPARCATCGFRVPLRGSLGQAFGLCANEISPSDGRVVSLDHGCGAHSEAVVVPTMAERAEPVIDEVGYESVDREAAADETVDATASETASETPDATTDPTQIELADEPPVLDHDAEPAGEPSDG